MTHSVKDRPATEQEACHIDARAAGCFGGEADPCHSGQPVPMDADRFMSLYTQNGEATTPADKRRSPAERPA